MEIKPYKQSLTHSCLAACFLMLNKKSFTENDEQQLALNGSKRTYPLYIVGIPMEFSTKFQKGVTVYVDNKYFAEVLGKHFIENKKIKVIHKPIIKLLIRDLLKEDSLICHIDDHVLGDYSHSSHFIILESATEKFVQIIDPWSGERKKISMDTLLESIKELKTQVKMCPLLFSLN